MALPTKTTNSKYVLLPAMGAWLILASTGTIILTAYSNSAGDPVDAPARLPEVLVARATPGRFTLFMFVHPKCPCSRSSMTELATLMTKCHDRVETHVLFFQPTGQPDDWSHTGLWKDAERIPNVSAVRDVDGQWAKSVRVETSGHVLLYDPEGDLAFSGGITAGRGHEGDNIGRTAVQTLVMEDHARHSSSPVFGCSITGVDVTRCNNEKGLNND